MTQEAYLSERTLGIRRIMKGIEDLFQCNDLFCLLIDCLPHNSIGSLAKLLQDVILSKDMRFNLFGHVGPCRY